MNIEEKGWDFKKIKRKPLWTNTKPYQSVLKDRFGFNIDEHPVIIFEYGNDIFYLKSQGIKYTKFNGDELLDNYCKDLLDNYNGVIVKKTSAVNPQNISLFSKDSLIDTTQIFVMDKKEFMECIRINNKSLDYTRNISKLKTLEILNNVLKNINNDNFSITRIDLVENKTISKLLYCSNEILEKDYKEITKKRNNQKDLEQINNVYNFDYSKYKNEFQNNLFVVFNDELEQQKQEYIDFCNQFEPDKYYSLINKLNMLDFNVNASSDEIDNYIDNDIVLALEIESFSDFEKEYYKQNPEVFEKEYNTFLNLLKDKYNELSQQKEKDYEKEHSIYKEFER